MPPKKWFRIFFRTGTPDSEIEEGSIEVEFAPGFSEQEQVNQVFKEEYGDGATLLDFSGEEIASVSTQAAD